MTKLGILAVLAAATVAAAPVKLAEFTSDAAFQQYLGILGVTLPAGEIVVAQARSGNNAANGDYEAGLHVPPNFTNAGPVGNAGQIRWGSAGAANAAVPFTFGRLGDTITFAMGNYSGSYTNPLASTLDSFALRVRSQIYTNGSTNRTLVDNLRINGQPLNDSALAENGSIEILLYSNLRGDFTMSGDTRIDWTGTFPNGSRMGFQIKGLDLPDPVFAEAPVPEPSTWLMLGSALGGIVWLKIRKPRG